MLIFKFEDYEISLENSEEIFRAIVRNSSNVGI